MLLICKHSSAAVHLCGSSTAAVPHAEEKRCTAAAVSMDNIICYLLQARAHLHAPGELPLGLHLVNSTNLDYFQPQHQAELFRLKGQFLQALGERDQANSNYSTALTIWDQLPDGWLSWGSHCDEMYESSGNHAWLEYAVSCYLQAVKHGSCAGRTMLPRVLHLLSFENDGSGAVGRALDRKLNEVCCRLLCSYAVFGHPTVSHNQLRLDLTALAHMWAMT